MLFLLWFKKLDIVPHLVKAWKKGRDWQVLRLMARAFTLTLQIFELEPYKKQYMSNLGSHNDDDKPKKVAKHLYQRDKQH